MKLDSRLLSTRLALLAVLPLAGFACSSVNRTPATGSDPTAGPMAPPEASEAASEPESNPEPSNSSGLTEDEILAIPPEVGSETDLLDIGAKSLEELNTEGHLKDVQFEYDSAQLSAAMRTTLEENAAWLSRYPSVSILVEGHCDERGTVEYNLALGEERARAVRDYLRDLGVGSGRMRIISYGKEFPLDPGHNEAAWRRNRRAHLEIVAK
ncbi:MAG: peptidoglycan-associated lipoprotein Pal [Acidobacteriota bacterium]|nr:peptidoglycan-associated lipoprotein Pal [Acidobacteriota bacterium]